MEESHAHPPHPNLTSAAEHPKARIALKDLWDVLPEPYRLETLRTLSRIIQQQLSARPPVEEEVRHEDC